MGVMCCWEMVGLHSPPPPPPSSPAAIGRAPSPGVFVDAMVGVEGVPIVVLSSSEWTVGARGVGAVCVGRGCILSEVVVQADPIADNVDMGGITWCTLQF